jgi:hypothetical protein
VGEIDIPVMRWYVGTFDLVTQVTQITLVDHLPVVFFVYTVDLEGFGFIDQVKQGRKGVAQGNATTATVAYIVDPLQFVKQLKFVIKIRFLPVQRVAGWRLEVAFAGCWW